MLPAKDAPTGRLADTLSGLLGRVVGRDSDRPPLKRVGVIVVDGLGAELLETLSGHARFLSSRLREHGQVVHSGLPSTTASALASITTGVTSGEHGLLGYQVRDPGSGEIVNHLKPFPANIQPEIWQPRPTLFEQAASLSIPSLAVGESRFSGTDFSRSILRGASFKGSSELDSHTGLLREFFDAHDEALAYLYWPALDRIGHQLGSGHDHWIDALEHLDVFATLLHASLGPGEAIILTADHGMVDVSPEHQVWCEASNPLRAQIHTWAGEPRFVHLYLHPGVLVPDFAEGARAWLAGRATVLERNDAIAQGLFGVVDDAHRGRIGDVVVLAESHFAIYDEVTATEQSRKMVGQHGSWTSVETSVPVIGLGS